MLNPPGAEFLSAAVERFAGLDDSEQEYIAAVYQAAYFGLSIYIGVVLVRAYKASLVAGGSPF